MTRIIIGTTPTITYKFKVVDVSEITVAILTIKERNTTLIEKDLSGATVGEDTLSSLSDVYPTLGSVWRVTIDGTSWITTARQDQSVASGAVYIGNPKYSGGQDDGSGMTTDFYNAGWGAWVGDTEISAGQQHTVKIERQVSA